jgi:hypothetical protein
VRCDRVQDKLAAAASGEAELAPAERRHVQRCLRCQAELAQHRRVGAGLRALGRSRVEPSPSVLAEVLAGLDAARGPVEESATARRHRFGYVAGLAAATAAGAVGAAVIASRARRPAGAHGQRMAG